MSWGEGGGGGGINWIIFFQINKTMNLHSLTYFLIGAAVASFLRK